VPDLSPNPSSGGPTETSGGAPASGSSVYWVFMGPKGLRSGWRIAIFLGICTVLIAGLNSFRPLRDFLRSLSVKGALTPVATLVSEVLSVLTLLAAAWIMTRIERRTFRDYGLPFAEAFGKRFWQGALLGFAMLSLLLAAIAAFHGFSLAGLAISGSAAARYGFLWALAFLMTGVFEDFSFRGYLQATLGEGIGFWPAALILAVIFGALHLSNPGEAIFGSVMAGSFGLVSAFSLWRTGNLWLSIAMHMSWDWGETYFYGTPDSGMTATGHLLNSSFHGAKWLTGGTVGPEGSWLVFPTLVVWALAIHFFFPARPAAAAK